MMPSYHFSSPKSRIIFTKSNYTYDEAGRLKVKEDKTAEGDVIARYDMTLDAVGNRTAMTGTQPLTPTVQAADVGFAHDAGNRLTSANDVTFAYDSKGNRIERVDGPVTTQYAYDYRNMLTRVSDGTHVQEYRYNSDGHRLKAVRDGVETRYVLDISGGMENILAEMDQNNNIAKYFVYGDGLLYSIDAATGKPLYYHYDSIGSTVALSDHTGSVTDQYAYLPFGEPAGKETVDENPFTYVGKYGVMEEPSGLYFMRARYYDPEMKRFLSVDPVKGDMKNSQALSPYLYVHGNPTSYTDPEGKFGLLAAYGVAALVGAAIFVAEDIYIHHKLQPEEHYSFFKQGFKTAITGAAAGVGGLTLALTCPQCIFAGAALAGAITTIAIVAYDVSGEEYNGYDTGNSNINSDTEVQKTATENKVPDGTNLSSGSLPNNSDNPDSSENQNTEAPKRPPHAGLPWLSSEYVFSYTSRYYMREFSKLLNSSLIDNQARSYIERRIYSEAAARAESRYREDDKDELEIDVKRKVRGLYKNFAQTLSKYSVLVKDITEIPNFNSLNMNRRGVYAK